MFITDELFCSSFYYIGPGFDIQPLWRFSHLCNTFLFVNLYLNQEEVRKWYERQVQYHDDAELLSVEEVAEFSEHTYLTPKAKARQFSLDTSFMTLPEQRDYAASFEGARWEAEWGLIFKIRRPSLDRVITLYYFTAEGLATYLGLSDNGRLAPRVLCTVDTKVLECPDGMMNRLLARDNVRKPLLWLRGFAPQYTPFRLTNHTLAERGAMPVRAMSFMHSWNCGWSYPYQQTTERHCRAFTTAVEADAMAAQPLQAEFEHATHRFVAGMMDAAVLTLDPAILVVIPRRLRAQLALPDEQVITWEADNYDRWWRAREEPVAKQVSSLGKRLAERNLPPDTELHLLPFCYEDEGRAYLQAIATLPYRTCTYLPEPADFLDLRIPRLGQAVPPAEPLGEEAAHCGLKAAP